jgi:hypothetical protein
MPRVLVEDAGGELSAGYVFKLRRWRETTAGETDLGGRLVLWELAGGAVLVVHPAGDATQQRGTAPRPDPLAYRVPVLTTALPSGGVRHWWACPACSARVDSLYLPPGRARLGCRRCCGLAYRSQRRAGRVRLRKERPGLWTETTYRRWEYDRLTGRLELVRSRKTRRRL